MAEPPADLSTAVAGAADLLKRAYLSAVAALWHAESALSGSQNRLPEVALDRLGRAVTMATRTRMLLHTGALCCLEASAARAGDIITEVRGAADVVDEAAAAVYQASVGMENAIRVLSERPDDGDRDAALTMWIGAQERLGDMAVALAAGRRVLHAYADLVNLGPAALADDPRPDARPRNRLRALLSR